MFRKITAVVAVLASLALAGCVSTKITRELAPECAQWAATQPALVDVKFSAALAGGIPINSIDVVGDVMCMWAVWLSSFPLWISSTPGWLRCLMGIVSAWI